MHKALTVVAVIVAAASIAGTASADPGAGAPPATSTATVGVIPDPGVRITTDPTKAPGHKGGLISPNILCGTCNGGGNVTGCATAVAQGNDGYGNWVKSFYHWCWLNGAISSNYGWQDEAACAFVCNFLGWNYNFDYPYGHQDKATFRDISVGGVAHYDTTAQSCVTVDGWGNAWVC